MLSTLRPSAPELLHETRQRPSYCDPDPEPIAESRRVVNADCKVIYSAAPEPLTRSWQDRPGPDQADFPTPPEKGPAHSFFGAPGQAGGSLLRREYALIYRAGLLNKTGPVEVTLRDKLHNFAHLLTTAGNSEEIFRQ
jgi:hypothetical protein